MTDGSVVIGAEEADELGKKQALVGSYHERFNQLLNLQLPARDIYLSSGLRKHVKKRHPNCVRYLKRIKEIIANPDYIGVHPREPNSVELVKVFDQNILVAIKLNAENSQYYVASLYEISEFKKLNRINSKRLVPYPGAVLTNP